MKSWSRIGGWDREGKGAAATGAKDEYCVCKGADKTCDDDIEEYDRANEEVHNEEKGNSAIRLALLGKDFARHGAGP